jgi:hypothetical protein
MEENNEQELEGFDARKVKPNTGFEAIPPGEYTCAIKEASRQETKSGTGDLLKLRIEIIAGDCKGRILWDQLNLWNKSAQASQIAQGQLSAICHAIGIMQPKRYADLTGKPLIATVGTEKYNGSDVNRVKAYKGTGEREKQEFSESESNAPW